MGSAKWAHLSLDKWVQPTSACGLNPLVKWVIDHAPLPVIWGAGLDLHQGLPEAPQWLESSLDTKQGADSF